MTDRIKQLTEERNALAQAIIDHGWHRGDWENSGSCDWCGYGQEPHWKNAPERHAHDCAYVAARKVIDDQTMTERLQEKNRDHA